jgi:hypothetical protein
MGRDVSWGTPGRSEHYLFPRGKWAYLAVSVLLGSAVAVFLLFLHVLGVRNPVSPGAVISQHAPIERRCEECHTPRTGASNLRCQRCHDPSGVGVLTNNTHVFWGSRDARKAAAAPNLPCAKCHVEHRGRGAHLAVVDEIQCRQCHFRGFSQHPEFAVFRGSFRGTPGIKFSHVEHIKAVVKERGLSVPGQTCVACHQQGPGDRDFRSVSFDRHCASCHGKNGLLEAGTEAVPKEDVLSLEEIRSQGVKGDWVQASDDFEESPRTLSKGKVHHKDEWVLLNLRKLRREVDPDGWAQDRAQLLARLSQLERRLALAAPLAALSRDALAERATTLQVEIRGLDARIKGQADAADPATSLSRIAEVLAAVKATGDGTATEEAQKLSGEAEALKGQRVAMAPLSEEEFKARQDELLKALDAIDAASPALKWRTTDLRRRIQSLSSGDSSLEVLTRAREQRLAQLDRVQDEIRLRDSGVRSPGEGLLAQQAAAIRAAIERTSRDLKLFEGPQIVQAGLAPQELARKKGSLESLVAACVKCHEITNGAMAPVRAARPVLVRAKFVHAPHLLPVQNDCFHCHASIEKSKLSADINFSGVQSCRECHKTWGVRQDCQICHQYHPPAVP